MKHTFQRTCVEWPETYVPDLTAMVREHAEAITRGTFLRHCDSREIEADLGYEQSPKKGLTMAGDWHVSYHRSFYRGHRVYFFKWSAIEHVFCDVDLASLETEERTTGGAPCLACGAYEPDHTPGCVLDEAQP